MSFINTNWWAIPLVITCFSGALCPAMGTVLITHNRLLQVNLISHCVLPGLTLAIALGVDPFIGVIISGLLGAILAEKLTNKQSENYAAVMNTILAGSLGLGVLFISLLGIYFNSYHSYNFMDIHTICFFNHFFNGCLISFWKRRHSIFSS